MKKLLLTAIFAFIGFLAFAQETIAVYPFEDMDRIFTRSEPYIFYDEFSNDFRSINNRNGVKFNLVPRQDVDRLFQTEADFQITNLSTRVKTAETQRVLNATQIISGRIAWVDNNLHVTVSLFTYPNMDRLCGAKLVVSNKTELFDKIPELAQKMYAALLEYLPDPNPFYGRWRSTIASNGQTLTCILDIDDDGEIVVEQYDTNIVTKRVGKHYNDIDTGRGVGTCAYRENGDKFIADITLTLSGVPDQFVAITARGSFSTEKPNQFTVTSMKCESFEGRIKDYYKTFYKM